MNRLPQAGSVLHEHLMLAHYAAVMPSIVALAIPLLSTPTLSAGSFPCGHFSHRGPMSHAVPRYPLLQWQARAGRRAVARLAQAGTWLRERVLLSRYAAVPLSNLGSDSSVAVADVLMARSLREANHVLWMRDPSLPNLGA